MRRVIVRNPGGHGAARCGAAAGAYLYLRRRCPIRRGRQRPGLTGDVEIVRDADAIPHIFASNKLDGLFGLGYVHAQDRLWQMEFQRRVGHGRLSEIFGDNPRPGPFSGTVGFGRAARSAWERLPADARRQVEAYVAGVNAFIGTHHGRRFLLSSPCFASSRSRLPGRTFWCGSKMMAWDLSANYTSELLRRDMLAKIGAERMVNCCLRIRRMA